MNGEWESERVDELFALHEQMAAVLRARLVAKKGALERRLQQLNQQSKLIETVKPGLTGLLMSLGHCGCAWKLLPLVLKSLSVSISALGLRRSTAVCTRYC